MLKVNFKSYGNYIVDSLYQWDTNQVLKITGLNVTTAPTILFFNRAKVTASPVASTLNEDVVSVPIPNGLLQDPYPIIAYIRVASGGSNNTIGKIKIPVVPSAKPEDYEFIENIEIISYEDMVSMIEGKVDKSEYDPVIAKVLADIEEIQTTGATAEVIENKVEIVIDELIASGAMATMTIEDGTITQEKLSPDIHFGVQDGEVTVEKLSGTEYEYPGGLNQIDLDNCTVGYTLNTTTGELVENSSYCVSNNMPVKDNTHFYAKVNDWDGNTYIVFYDSSDTFVSGVKIGQTNTGIYREIPTGAAYAKACFRGVDKTPVVIFADEAIASVNASGLIDDMQKRYINNPWGKLVTKELQSYFADESIALSALKGVGANMYNLFDVSSPYAEGCYLLPLRKTYYIYNMSDENITNGTLMMYVMKKNRGSQGIHKSFIDVGTHATSTVNDELYEDALLVYVSCGSLTENQRNGLVISERDDLEEYHAYGEMYYDPDTEAKKFVQAAREDIVKQYDGGVMLTIGDSYTAYMNSHFSTFAKKHGLVQDNRGLASSTIAGDLTGSIGYKPFWDRIDTAISEYNAGHDINGTVYSNEDVKLITFMGGANDWSTVNDTVNRLGTGPHNTDKGTLYGALNYCFATLLKSFPNADIVCILQPCNYSSTVPTTEENAKNVGFESLSQAQQMTDAQYSVYVMQRKERIVRTMAEQYGLPIADCCFSWYNPCNPNDAAKYWQSDKLHCTREGHDAIIKVLEKTVNNLPFNRN